VGAPVPILAWDDERNHPVLRAIDPATGQDAAGYAPIALAGERDMAYWSAQAFSSDGRRLALFERSGQFCRPTAGGTACGPRSESLRIVDLVAWSAVPVTLPASGWSGPLAFSPDQSKLLASVEGERETSLYLIDVGTGDVLSAIVSPVTPSLLGFTGDGGEAIVFGQAPVAEPGVSRPEAPLLLLLDSASLDSVWETELPGVVAGHWCVEGCDKGHERWISALWMPGVRLSPDGDTLSIVHADEAVLTTVDLRGRAVREEPIEATRSWFDRVMALRRTSRCRPMDRLSTSPERPGPAARQPTAVSQWTWAPCRCKSSTRPRAASRPNLTLLPRWCACRRMAGGCS
jgi:hypothetical protein